MIRRFFLVVTLLVVAEYYSFIATRGLLRYVPPFWRNIGMGAYLTLSVLLWVLLLSFRRIPWDSMPSFVRTIAISFAMGFFIAKILVALFLLLDDVRRLVMWAMGYLRQKPALVGDGSRIPRSVFVQNAAIGVGTAVIRLFLYGTTNRYRYRIHRVRLRLPNIPKGFDGFKMVQLSDIHSGSFDNRKAVAEGIRKIMAEKPEIIFFTGDLVNNESPEIVPYKDLFGSLRAPMGVYSTLGNHDYGDYVSWPDEATKARNLAMLERHHAEMGWQLMQNVHTYLERNGDTIGLIGVENWGAKAGFPKYGDLPKATAGLDRAKAPFNILLSHDPSHWDAQVRPEYPWIDLMFSGHTHGMQFGVDIPGFKWSPIKYVYEQWAGLYRKANQHLYVNRGFGFLGYPGRVGILPEITVITLESGAA